MACHHWLEDDTLVIFNLQPTWIAGLSNCKIRSSDLCYSLCLFKMKTTTPSRQIYINCSSSNLERKFWKGIWNFMVKTCFQIKASIATRTREMRASQWYQSFEELMEKYTYWSWVAELWNWTSMEQYRSRFLKVIIWLASGKIKEGELMEKLDWKRLESRFQSCWILSYGTSLAGWFWLSKLEKTNGVVHVFIEDTNGIKRKSEWCILEGIRANLMHEWSVIQTSPKLIQFLCFDALIHLGKLANQV